MKFCSEVAEIQKKNNLYNNSKYKKVDSCSTLFSYCISSCLSENELEIKKCNKKKNSDACNCKSHVSNSKSCRSCYCAKKQESEIFNCRSSALSHRNFNLCANSCCQVDNCVCGDKREELEIFKFKLKEVAEKLQLVQRKMEMLPKHLKCVSDKNSGESINLKFGVVDDS